MRGSWTAKRRCAGERVGHPLPDDGRRRRAGALRAMTSPPRMTSSVGTAWTAKRAGRLRGGVDVDLGELDRPGEVRGHLLQRRADHPARSAPGRPQVDEHRAPSPRRRPRRTMSSPAVGDPRQRLVAVPAARHAGAAAGTRFRCPQCGHATILRRAATRHGRPRWIAVVARACRRRRRRPGSPRRRATSPASSARPMRVSTSRAMNRRSGRAPYTGSKPRSAMNRRAPRR